MVYYYNFTWKSLIYSNGSFSSLFKFYLDFLSNKKKKISVFVLNFLFFSFRILKTQMRNFFGFFSLFILSQLSRKSTRTKIYFLNFFFILLKNLKKRKTSNKDIIYFFSLLINGFPSGFSLNFSFIAMFFGEALKFSNVLGISPLLEKLFIRFKVNSGKNDLVYNIISKIFLGKKNFDLKNLIFYQIHDKKFLTMFIKKVGKINIFNFFFLKKKFLPFLHFFSRWNIEFFFRLKKKKNKNIQNLKDIFFKPPFFFEKIYFFRKKSKNRYTKFNFFLIQDYERFFLKKLKNFLEINYQSIFNHKYFKSKEKNIYFFEIQNDRHSRKKNNFFHKLKKIFQYRYLSERKKNGIFTKFISNSSVSCLNKIFHGFDNYLGIKVTSIIPLFFLIKFPTRSQIKRISFYSSNIKKDNLEIKNLSRHQIYLQKNDFRKKDFWKIINRKNKKYFLFFYYTFKDFFSGFFLKRRNFSNFLKLFPKFKKKIFVSYEKNQSIKIFIMFFLKQINFLIFKKIKFFFLLNRQKKKEKEIFFFMKQKKFLKNINFWILFLPYWLKTLLFLGNIEKITLELIFLLQISLENFYRLSGRKKDFFKIFVCSSFLYVFFLNNIFEIQLLKVFHFFCTKIFLKKKGPIEKLSIKKVLLQRIIGKNFFSFDYYLTFGSKPNQSLNFI